MEGLDGYVPMAGMEPGRAVDGTERTVGLAETCATGLFDDCATGALPQPARRTTTANAAAAALWVGLMYV